MTRSLKGSGLSRLAHAQPARIVAAALVAVLAVGVAAAFGQVFGGGELLTQPVRLISCAHVLTPRWCGPGWSSVSR